MTYEPMTDAELQSLQQRWRLGLAPYSAPVPEEDVLAVNAALNHPDPVERRANRVSFGDDLEQMRYRRHTVELEGIQRRVAEPEDSQFKLSMAAVVWLVMVTAIGAFMLGHWWGA
jgi:hypothetical protein